MGGFLLPLRREMSRGYLEISEIYSSSICAVGSSRLAPGSLDARSFFLHWNMALSLVLVSEPLGRSVIEPKVWLSHFAITSSMYLLLLI